ncbi:transporter substrate-binding domain-containing protein [Undibacterium sp. LX40W]|uniref:Transporter substrate-binding domain-containing protein n=1 Tax=Undibacterium nitidum TaxID=2762298 RepID=A0A923HIK6_9BURK|nr:MULTISPECIES: ABC transporter substrate-binding protein [Undibacterium]MBC3880069.1 transporter substrate-binding domain-containing protein [Undibacterium nitidum]MBC3891195.1 transporter substrate-binding domain-containing protein [Undibacterium sp. LX40W]
MRALYLLLIACLLFCHADCLAFQLESNAILRVYTEHLPPYNYLDNGKFTGYSTEILEAMLKEADIPANFTLLPWGRAYLSSSSEPNTLLYTTTRTPEREAFFEWIGPIGPRKMMLFKLAERTDIHIKSKEDLKKYRVGIVRDTSAIKLVVDRGLFSRSQIDEAPSTTSNMKKLFFKRIDIILATNGGATYELSKLPYKLKDIEPIYTLDEEYLFYFAINRKSDAAVITKLKHAFEKVKSSGLMDALRKKYSVD